MTFEPQNEFEGSLLRAATDPAHRARFLKDFVASDVFFIQHGPLPPGTAGRGVLEKGFQIGIQPIEHEGREYLPIFSSLSRLQAAMGGGELANYIALNALVLLEATRGADLALNPGSECGRTFSAPEIAAILDGSIWQPQGAEVLPAETQLQLREPENYPHDLADALKRFFNTRKDVKRAWLATLRIPGREQPPGTLLGLEVTGDMGEIVGELGRVVQHIPLPDPPLQIVQMTGPGGLGDYFLSTRPFYARKFLGIF